MNQRILNCELEYYKCFSETVEYARVIRFSDKKLKDMYYHNFTYINDVPPFEKLNELVDEESLYNRNIGRGFCNILLNSEYENMKSFHVENSPEISINGYYTFDSSKLDLIVVNSDVTVEKVCDKAMLEEVLYCYLQADENRLGRDFCQRRCYRRGEVYIAEGGVDTYICYLNGKPVGNCDLFIHDKVAKIEDFEVIPQYRRRGFGTAILKHLIKVSLDKSCDIVFLVTDEEDTAKEMYQKLYFSKVGERTDLFYKI